MGAGLSHAPIDSSSSRERYVFFSFPHIAIDDEGNLGKIHRPGRAGESAACGALLTALSLFQARPAPPSPPPTTPQPLLVFFSMRLLER